MELIFYFIHKFVRALQFFLYKDSLKSHFIERLVLEDNGMCNFFSKLEVSVPTQSAALFIIGLFESG